MVTQSNLDWPIHKQEVYQEFLKNYPEKTVNIFKDYYEKTYNQYNRAFLHYKVCWSLLDDYFQVKNSGIRWYGVVGSGGTGKTTLAFNVLYYLDNTFNINRVCWSAKEFVKVLGTFPPIDAMKAILLDEPDTSVHSQSREGKALANILGKARQQKIFAVYCATDLSDIPAYIFRKLTGIFFTPKLGTGIFFKDMPEHQIYPMGEIRRNYAKKGYRIFYELMKNKYGLLFKTQKYTPLPPEDILNYLQSKKADYLSSIASYNNTNRNTRVELIDKLMKEGHNYKEISKILGVDASNISKINTKRGITKQIHYRNEE